MTSADQLRCRRAASRRCEPLQDGRADPLDKAPARAKISVRILGSGTGEFATTSKALDRVIAQTCTTLGVRFQRAPRARGAWLVRADGVDDVLTRIEGLGYTVEAVL